MANYQNLKAAISAAIRTNGNQEITGQVLQDVLNSIVSVIGANYTFAGVATPATNPGTPDQNVMYLAMEGGTYTNFNGTVLPAGISVLMWNGSWTSETVMYGDGGVFDISVYKSSGGTLATFADLSAALDGGNNIPASARKGGMSVKFVQSSDNKYVQYRLVSQTFNTNSYYWQKEDDEPMAKSDVNSILTITRGAINSFGEYVDITSRALSGYLEAPFEIEINSGYKAYTLAKYTKAIDGTYTFVSSESMKGENINDTSYVYRIIFCKSDFSSVISPSEYPSIVSSFKGKVDYINRLVDEAIYNSLYLRKWSKLVPFICALFYSNYKYQANYDCKLVPVIGGDTVTIKANSTQRFYFVIVKDFVIPKNDGVSTDYDLATGEEGRRDISPNGTVTITIPSDAKYLVCYSHFNNVDTSPVQFDINGYDILNRHEFPILQQNINNRIDGLEKEYHITDSTITRYIELISGAIDSQGNYGSINTRAISKYMIQAPFSIEVYSDYRVYTLARYTYVNGNISFYDIYTVNNTRCDITDTNYLYIPSFCKSDYTSNISSVLDSIIKSYESRLALDEKEVSKLFTPLFPIRLGAYTSSGYVTNNARATTDNYVSAPFTIRMADDEYILYTLVRYRKNGDNYEFVDVISSMELNGVTKIGDTNYYYRPIFCNKNYTSTVDISILKTKIGYYSHYDSLMEKEYGSGNREYKGKKINLNIFASPNLCKQTRLVTETANQRHQNNAQALAVYGNYMFSFGDNTNEETGHDVAIYNRKTGAFVGYASLDVGVENHNNNAQFTNIFYDPADYYPLILLSQSVWDNLFFVVRLTESNGEFTFTLVKTISTDSSFTELHHADNAAIDISSGEFVIYTYDKGPFYPGTPNNAGVVYRFRCPSLVDGVDYTLTSADFISKFYLPYTVWQGAYAIDGKLYAVTQGVTRINGMGVSGKHRLEVINLNTGYIESVIDDITDFEEEGIAIYEGLIYIMCHNNGATEDEMYFNIDTILP